MCKNIAKVPTTEEEINWVQEVGRKIFQQLRTHRLETKATFSQTGGRDGRAEGAATEGDFYRK